MENNLQNNSLIDNNSLKIKIQNLENISTRAKNKSSIDIPKVVLDEKIKEIDSKEEDSQSSSSDSNTSSQNLKQVDELLSIKDIKRFYPEDFSIRKYNKNNIASGKIFFKYRYIKIKIKELKPKKDTRMSTILNLQEINMINLRKNQVRGKRLSVPSLNINKIDDKFEDKDEFRKFNSEFLTIVEKSIIYFNLKKYEESYKVLFKEKIINSEEEFGEFLLVINGYDKNILGSFLSKDKPPNNNKVVINGFINSIDLKYIKNISNENTDINNNYFLECLRFLLSRLNLPQDANLILLIMDIYSTHLFNSNKENEEFITKYSSINAIYLLISTILALNTMFTRKDIKNMNIIKKEQFLEMNKDIEAKEAQDIYEKLEKNPISMSYNYNDIIYQKMSVLVKEKGKKINKSYRKSITTMIKDNNQVKSFDNKTFQENDEIIKTVENINKDIISNKENKDNNNFENLDLNENINIKEKEENINNRHNSVENLKVLKRNNSSLNLENKRKSVFEQDIQINNRFYKDDNDDTRQISFSFRENLYSFSEKDQLVLKKPTKFLKFVNKSSHHLRMFFIDDKMEKLKWSKEIEFKVNSDDTIKILKIKGISHSININEIEDVYNGIGKSELISEYVKLFPNEGKEPYNFITIKTPSKTICIKSEIQQIGLSWFKALKSLIIKNKNYLKKNNNNSDKISYIKCKVKEIWNNLIFSNWEKYGNYLYYQLQNKINFIKNEKKSIVNSKNGLLNEKISFSLNSRNNFVLEALEKLDNNNYFDYNEFLYFYNLGLPSKIRGKIWTLLIGNQCQITLNLYKSYSNSIPNIDFEKLIKEYNKNKNIDNELLNIKEDLKNDKFIINQILLDILNLKDNFIIKYTIAPSKILSMVYTITRVFFLMRPDIKYNKSLVAFSFIFILVCKDEYTSFCNIFNLVCSTNILQYYLRNEDYIDIRVKFFDELLKKEIPKVSLHFKNLDISCELFLVSWFENIFSFTLNYHLLRRIFDLYLLYGEYILFQVGLTIIKIQEDELLNFTISDVFKVLGRLPEEYKEEIFLEKMALNNIYNDYKIWKINRDINKQKNRLALVFK